MTKPARGLHMAEDEHLKPAVLQMCARLGLRTAHFRKARTVNGWRTPVEGDGMGFPDLVIVGSRLIVRELKADTGTLRPDQELWIAAFQVARVDVDVWMPADLRSGRIHMELLDIKPRRGSR